MGHPALLRQLRDIPAAAEGADQAYAGDELAGLEVDGGALILEQGGLGGQDFEIAGDAAFVALVGEVEGVLGGGDGALLGSRFLLREFAGWRAGLRRR